MAVSYLALFLYLVKLALQVNSNDFGFLGLLYVTKRTGGMLQ